MKAITFAPFRLAQLLQAKQLDSESAIRNFVPLVQTRGLITEIRAVEYARLEDIKTAGVEKSYSTLLDGDCAKLDQNDMATWNLALHNWVQLLDAVISFKDELAFELTNAVDRLHAVVSSKYWYGSDSEITQRAIREGSYLFSAQVSRALQLGMSAATEGVLDELRLLPRIDKYTPLGYLLESCEHCQNASRALVAKPSVIAKPPKPVAQSIGAVPGRADKSVRPSPADIKNRICLFNAASLGCKFSPTECRSSHRMPTTKQEAGQALRALREKGWNPTGLFAVACVALD
jgi:hypothetical protein